MLLFLCLKGRIKFILLKRISIALFMSSNVSLTKYEDLSCLISIFLILNLWFLSNSSMNILYKSSLLKDKSKLLIYKCDLIFEFKLSSLMTRLLLLFFKLPFSLSSLILLSSSERLRILSSFLEKCIIGSSRQWVFVTFLSFTKEFSSSSSFLLLKVSLTSGIVK